jgi:flagellin-like hook-associated protein FlgL
MKGILEMSEKVDFLSYLNGDVKKEVKITEVKDVSTASNNYLKVESDILALENQIKSKKAELQQMNDSIVQLMEQRGVKEIKLMNGDAVSFKPFFKGSITKDNEREAFEWLENNNLGDIIKNIVSVRFGKGDNEVAIDLIQDLEKQGLSPDQKRKVEPMTLNALIGEQINDGKAFPLELFSVYMGNKVKIKRGK